MQITKNFQLSIKTLSFSLTLIIGLILNLTTTTKIVLAGVGWEQRAMTRIEWESGEPMNCNGKGVEFLVTGSNMHSTFYNLTVACLNQNRENQADWVILGGISYVYKNNRSDAFLQKFDPETQHSGERPNLYSFANFVIGYNCSLNRGWECEEYSSSIENNVLKTFGSQELKSTTDSFPFNFSNLAESAYTTTNAQ
ncbi:hypothetical protein M595_0777 [Lyngbya aestuarii BL J]|uniref:Uncharacterized protein n=1 Tax=Lyngbya aestuarii BL J TaxID=1348334 RepID=U7QQH1_9CYAN|nr:hypothetical protein [Lyngbya aestuarii]ERT09360.1 hypothetical protein M595_0777 [Lyngbya aestuarii BL J]